MNFKHFHNASTAMSTIVYHLFLRTAKFSKTSVYMPEGLLWQGSGGEPSVLFDFIP